MGDMDSLYTVLDSVLGLFDKLLDVESSKLDAIALNNIDKLDESMLAEQAMTLELKGLDLRRERVQSELGLDGLTLKQIIAKTDGEDAARLGGYYERLSEKNQELDVSIECTNKFIELHLRSIDFMLYRLDEQKSGEESAAYEKSGEVSADEGRSPRFKPTKI